MRAAGAGRAPGGSGGGGGIGGGGGGRGGGGGGGGGRERSAPLLDRDEFRVVSSFWPEYFPEEVRCKHPKCSEMQTTLG